jgi:hypothetical protein
MDHQQGKKSHPHGKSWKACITNSISNTNGLPAEHPFIASAVQIQRIVRGIATRKEE